MQLIATKSGLWETFVQPWVALVGVLTFFAILGAAGYLLVRLAGRSGLQIPVPRSLHRPRRTKSYRRMASDQPFHVRVGWTTDAEPGGPLSDARKVTPFGPYGGGLYTDGFVAVLVLAAIFGVILGTFPLGALILPLHILAWGLIGFALVSLVRWLRYR